MIAECGATLTHGTEWWSVRDGEPQLNVRRPTHEPIILPKLLELTEDLSITDFLQKYFSEPEYAELREYISRRVEGYWAGDPARASAFALRNELSSPDHAEQHFIREGYAALLKYLESEIKKYGGKILLGKEVKRIDFSSEMVQVQWADSARNDLNAAPQLSRSHLPESAAVFEAKKVIITLSLPLIEKIEFVPALPEKIAAAQKIGYGSVIKVLLRFKTRWWAGARQQNFENLFFMFSGEAVPTWWTQYPEMHATLTGWLAGPKSLALAEKSDAELVEIALQSLSNIFKISIEELRQELIVAKIFDWPKDPHALGAYSYPTPETEEAVAELIKPVDDKLFFAGEALAEGEIAGTVEAALASGKHAAEQILQIAGE